MPSDSRLPAPPMLENSVNPLILRLAARLIDIFALFPNNRGSATRNGCLGDSDHPVQKRECHSVTFRRHLRINLRERFRV